MANLTRVTLLLPLAALLSATPAVAQPEKKSWSQKHPELAVRIGNLDKRMSSDDVHIRKRVLNALLSGRPRDSKQYPPFLRDMLRDPSPNLRGDAIEHLWEHNQFLDRKDLPATFHVHFVGVFDWNNAQELQRVRDMARSSGPDGGWAIHALGIVGDKESIATAKTLLASNNVFTRFSAAVALVQLGERQAGIDALHGVTDARDDAIDYYRLRAAEVLYRLGEKKAIETLFAVHESNKLREHLFGPLEILEDLTGQFFSTAAEWREWWRRQP
jgi:HEAT repeat protein